MKSLVESVMLLDTALKARILGALSPTLLTAVQDAIPIAWLPIAANVELADTIAACLGPDRARPFFRQVLLAEYESSLFKPFIEGVSRALGVTPTVFVKMAPRGWQLVYRACGRLEPGELVPGRATLVLSDLPTVCVKNALWLDAVRSTFYTAFDLSNTDGEIEWDELNLGARRAVMRFRWEA